MEAVNNPEDPTAGTRTVPFSRELYIEQDDFREVPPKQLLPLFPGKEVRLRYGYLIKCTGVVKNAPGEVTEVHCTYDPETRGRQYTRRAQGEIHDSLGIRTTRHRCRSAHLRNPIHQRESQRPRRGPGVTDLLNPNSLEVVSSAKVEPSLASPAAGGRYQFERTGYFAVDPSTAPGKPVFNRTVALRDTWAKIEKQSK